VEPVRPSQEVINQEELEAWRYGVGRHSIQLVIPGAAHNFEELYSALEAMIDAVGDKAPFTIEQVNQLRLICSEVSEEHGESRAFALMIECTSNEAYQLAQELQPKLEDVEEKDWSDIDTVVAELEYQSDVHRGTLAPKVLSYYDQPSMVTLEIYLPADGENARGFMD